jgi:hypothetical protein
MKVGVTASKLQLFSWLGDTISTQCCAAKWGCGLFFCGQIEHTCPPRGRSRFDSLSLAPREYWTIYRGQGFLAFVWFCSSPPPHPHSPESKLDPPTDRKTEKERQVADGRGEGGGWMRSQIIRWRESLALYKSFNTLWWHPPGNDSMSNSDENNGEIQQWCCQWGVALTKKYIYLYIIHTFPQKTHKNIHIYDSNSYVPMIVNWKRRLRQTLCELSSL